MLQERRSYANDKDLDSVVCSHCGSVNVIKYGKSKAVRDISGKNVKALSGIPTVQLPFAPSCLSVNGLS